MSRLNIDIPETTHQRLKVCAAQNGITIKDLILECLAPRLSETISAQDRRQALMDAWRQSQKNFRLERGEQSFGEIAHEGHRW